MKGLIPLRGQQIFEEKSREFGTAGKTGSLVDGLGLQLHSLQLGLADIRNLFEADSFEKQKPDFFLHRGQPLQVELIFYFL